MMLGFLPLIGGLFGLKGRAASIVGGILSALVLFGIVIGAWKLWLHGHDKGVVAQHEAVIANQVSAETNTGTAKADAQANVTDARNGEIHNQVEEAINNAVTAHPQEARRPAGRVSQSALDKLRARRR